MITRSRYLITVAMLAAFLTAAASAQGLYWESKISGGPSGESTMKSYYMPKKFKTTTGNSGEYAILRLDSDKMMTVDPTGKTYWEMTFTEIEAKMKSAAPKVSSQMEALRKKMESMPEDQRKLMEEKMGGLLSMGSGDSKYTVNATGETKTISGFACAKYQVLRDGKELLTLWTTKDVKDFNSMRDEFKTFNQKMMAMNPMTGKGLGEAMQKVEGFPIETDMQMGMSIVVTKVDRRGSPESEFVPPSDYKKVDPPSFGGK